MIVEFTITVTDDKGKVEGPSTLRIEDAAEVLEVVPIGIIFQEKWNVMKRKVKLDSGEES